MTFKTLLRTCGASALIGAMALATAAHAEDERPGRGQRSAQSETASPAERQQWRAQRAEQRAQAAAPQRQYTRRSEQQTYSAPQAQQQRSRGEWNRGASQTAAPVQRQMNERAGREWNRRGNTANDWGQARAAQAQAEAQVRQREQARAQTGRAQEWQRNRSYTDRSRNTTYSSGYRDGRTADRQQDRYQQNNAYRTGYRDGVRTDYRNGSRYDGNRRGYQGTHQRWSNDWRRDNRYNWRGYRNTNRSAFNIGVYYAPYRNYRYSRLGIGFNLPSLFYSNNYWINDPWQYRLPPAYGPYRWVRYYDDALLVDIYSGEVVDVVYDFFW